MTHGFCVVAHSSLSSFSHNSSAAWFHDQCRFSANSNSASIPSIFNHSDGAFGSFKFSPYELQFLARRLLRTRTEHNSSSSLHFKGQTNLPSSAHRSRPEPRRVSAALLHPVLLRFRGMPDRCFKTSARKKEYNEEGPHSSFGSRTPTDFDGTEKLELNS